MSNNYDLIMRPLDILYSKLRAKYPQLDDDLKRSKCEALGKDCRWQIDRLNALDLTEEEWKTAVNVDTYGCVSLGGNGLCYECKLFAARPGRHNCQRCADWPALGHTVPRSIEKKIEIMKNWAKTDPKSKKPSLFQRVTAKKGKKCHYCDKDATTVDHVIPKSRGGSNRMDNLVPACRECNHKKADLPVEDFTLQQDVSEVFGVAV